MSEWAHMYLSRLFILFHFNIAIDVIAAVENLSACCIIFTPLDFPIYAQPIACDVDVDVCASVRDVKVMLYKSFRIVRVLCVFL